MSWFSCVTYWADTLTEPSYWVSILISATNTRVNVKSYKGYDYYTYLSFTSLLELLVTLFVLKACASFGGGHGGHVPPTFGMGGTEYLMSPSTKYLYNPIVPLPTHTHIFSMQMTPMVKRI